MHAHSLSNVPAFAIESALELLATKLIKPASRPAPAKELWNCSIKIARVGSANLELRYNSLT